MTRSQGQAEVNPSSHLLPCTGWHSQHPTFCLRGENYDSNKWESPASAPGAWTVSTGWGEGCRLIEQVSLNLPVACSAICVSAWQQQVFISIIIVLLLATCPYPSADLKMGQILHLGLWKIWLKCTQPPSNFALGSQNTRVIFRFIHCL